MWKIAKKKRQIFFIRIEAEDIDGAVKEAEKLFGEVNRVMRKHSDSNEAGFIVNNITMNLLEEKLKTLGGIL